MKKGKLVLSAIALFALVGGAFAFKATRINDKLAYLTTTTTQQGGQPVKTCLISEFLTTTTTTVGTVAPPVGAIGWYTTIDCTGLTFRAVASPN